MFSGLGLSAVAPGARTARARPIAAIRAHRSNRTAARTRCAHRRWSAFPGTAVGCRRQGHPHPASGRPRPCHSHPARLRRPVPLLPASAPAPRIPAAAGSGRRTSTPGSEPDHPGHRHPADARPSSDRPSCRNAPERHPTPARRASPRPPTAHKPRVLRCPRQRMPDRTKRRVPWPARGLRCPATHATVAWPHPAMRLAPARPRPRQTSAARPDRPGPHPPARSRRSPLTVCQPAVGQHKRCRWLGTGRRTVARRAPKWARTICSIRPPVPWRLFRRMRSSEAEVFREPSASTTAVSPSLCLRRMSCGTARGLDVSIAGRRCKRDTACASRRSRGRRAWPRAARLPWHRPRSSPASRSGTIRPHKPRFAAGRCAAGGSRSGEHRPPAAAGL